MTRLRFSLRALLFAVAAIPPAMWIAIHAYDAACRYLIDFRVTWFIRGPSVAMAPIFRALAVSAVIGIVWLTAWAIWQWQRRRRLVSSGAWFKQSVTRARRP